MHRTQSTNVQSPPRAFVLRPARGFSLLEVLFATALVALMASLVVPSIEGFSSAGGRKGAVIIVMNALEHARVTAITRNAEVEVLLQKNSGDEPDTLEIRMVDGATPVTRKIRLPRGVLIDAKGLASPTSSVTPKITFTPSGALNHSEDSSQLFIALTEGQRGADGNLSVDRQKQGGQEIIGLARLTGRASLDISAL